MTSEWQKQSVGGSITPSSFFVSRSSLLLRSCPSAGGWCVPYRCYCFSLEWARQCHRRAPWASRVRWDIYEHYMSSWYCLMVVLYGKCYLFTLAWLRFSRWRFTGGCWIHSFTSPCGGKGDRVWIFRMLSGAVVVSYRAVLGTCVQVTMYGRWKKIMRILSVSFVILWYRFPRMASTNLVGICAPYTWLHVWDFGLRFPMGWKHCWTTNHCFLLLMIFNT